jgi:hypothetical protein
VPAGREILPGKRSTFRGNPRREVARPAHEQIGEFVQPEQYRGDREDHAQQQKCLIPGIGQGGSLTDSRRHPVVVMTTAFYWTISAV